MKVFIITPCGRESDVILEHHNKVIHEMQKIECHFSINYIIDSYTDSETIKILETLTHASIVYNDSYQGLAGCYKRGYVEFLKSDYDYVLELDIESHPPDKICEFIFAARAGYDIILGSRNINNFNNKSSLNRRIISSIGSYISVLFLNSPLTDSTSGFQMYSRKVIETIDFKRLLSSSYFFQTEIKMLCVNQFTDEIQQLIGKFPFYTNQIIKFYDFCYGYQRNRKHKFLEIPFVYTNSKSSISYSKIFDSFIECVKFYLR